MSDTNTKNFRTILYTLEGPLAVITLNRPDKLNAINPVMISELNQAMDHAEKDDKVRVILLEGSGRAFSAGFDLDIDNDTGDDGVEFWEKELKRDFDIIMRFWDCPKPTVSAVHTYCLGSAMEMAVACDITLATDDCRFGAPEVVFGSGIVALILPWLIGVKAAKEMLLTGDDKVTAERALSLGLINRIVQMDKLHDEVRDLALTIAANDQLAVTKTKQAINESYDTMGMRKALLLSLQHDVAIETTDTPESIEFNTILKQKGVKAAIAWRHRKITA